MITLLKNNTIFKVCALIVFGLCAFAFTGVSSAEANFKTKQTEVFDKNYKYFMAMDKSLTGIHNYYVNTEADFVYWSDPVIVKHYQNYLDNLVAYQDNVASFWKFSTRAFSNKRLALGRTVSSTKPTLCKKKSMRKKARALMTQAKTQRTAATKNYQNARKSWNQAQGWANQVNTASVEIADIINGSESVPITDGHKDDAVYEFGSMREINVPGGASSGEEFDPLVLSPLTDLIYSLDYQVNRIVETHFAKRLDFGIRKAKQSSRIISNCG